MILSFKFLAVATYRRVAAFILMLTAALAVLSAATTDARAQSIRDQVKPNESTILAPPPRVPIPPQGEVPTGAPAQLPAAKGGQTGRYYIGHRYYGEKEAGWGWIKNSADSWANAKWCAIKETPGVIVAPFRTLPNRWDDHNHEYKFWGRWASYTAYDPHRDEDLPVFILEGYESLGPKPELKRTPGAVRRNRPSRGSTSR
ncbi:hypothetical protein DB346_02250 [Verrucomicrobia bacterium LW23]|nr:hypothetical protein DB346_02250 [Verrucomicrobia bacterium LW23]